MSILFRRRIKIIPGVRLNISKSGLSASVGVRGASVTFGGRGGTYANLGIPGTGIYTRKRIDGRGNPIKEENIDQEYSQQENIENPDESYVSAEPFELTSTGLQALKDAVLEANNQRKLLKKDLKKIKFKVFKTKLLKIIFQITLLYFLKPIKKRIKENLYQLDEVIIQIKNGIDTSYVNLELELNEKAIKQYEKVLSSFKALTTTNFIWDITSANDVDMIKTRSTASQTYERVKTTFSLQELPGIKSSFNALCLQNKNGADIYIYPGFLVMFNSEENFGILELNKIDILFSETNFIESEQRPSDSVIVKYVWEKANKNGSRDKRFADNRQLPVMKYGEITLFKRGAIYEKYMFSNSKRADTFVDNLNKFLVSI